MSCLLTPLPRSNSALDISCCSFVLFHASFLAVLSLAHYPQWGLHSKDNTKNAPSSSCSLRDIQTYHGTPEGIWKKGEVTVLWDLPFQFWGPLGINTYTIIVKTTGFRSRNVGIWVPALPSQARKSLGVHSGCMSEAAVGHPVTIVGLVDWFLKFIYLFNWKIILYNVVMVFAIHGMNLLQVYMCLPHPESPPTSLPTPSLWVVPEYWLWMPCFMHGTCTGHLVYIW